MHLHRTPKTVEYTSCFRFKSNKGLFLESGPFSRKSFSRKNCVGGWWRLDEVVEPSLQLVCSRAQELFLWHLHQLKWKLMIVIMRLRIKSLPNLVGRKSCC